MPQVTSLDEARKKKQLEGAEDGAYAVSRKGDMVLLGIMLPGEGLEVILTKEETKRLALLLWGAAK